MTVTQWFLWILLIVVVFILVIRDVWRTINQRIDNRPYVRDERRAEIIAKHTVLSMPKRGA